MEISKLHFLELYTKIVEKFSGEFSSKYGVRPTSMQTFGLKGFDKKKWTLKDAMMNNPEVSKFMEKANVEKKAHERAYLNSRYLYEKKNRTEKDSHPATKSVQVNAPYQDVFFLYLGFKNYPHYIEKRSSTATQYKGYYYSFKHHEVRDFDLLINYNLKPNIPGVQIQDFYVEERGFHDSQENPIYEGYSYLLEGKLQLILWSRKAGDRLRIILESGDNPEENKAMRGAVLAVSSAPGRPLSNAEIVVVKEQENPMDERDKLRIKRYLFMHRYNFRIRTQSLNLKRMDAKGEPADIMRHFVGVWRGYRYNLDYSKILPSILWVREDYRIICLNNNYDRENLNEQVCLPNITIDSELNTRTICIDCFPKEGAKIISSMMLNVPSINDKGVVSGVITLVGQDGAFPSMKALILFRDVDLEKRIANQTYPVLILKDTLLKSVESPISKTEKKALDKIELYNRFPH